MLARTLPLCSALFLLSALAAAAPTPEPTETVIRLQVSPAAAPRPALKYHLLPELRETQPGQVVHNFLKCFAEQQNLFFNKDTVEKREKYLVMPLAELPLNELRGYGGGAVKQAHYAARLDTVDWQILPLIRRDGMHTLLPEIQQLRTLASVLKVRFRAEVAERRFDDAVGTAKTMFALGRALGEHPTLIGGLVGVAISFVGIGPVEEMIGQPGCPNLYWALTNLPDPLVSLRKGVEGERFILGVDLAGLDDAEPKTAEELKKLTAKVVQITKLLDGPKMDADVYLAEKLADAGHVKAARRRLVAAGFDAKKVAAYLPGQAVLMDEKLTFDAERDEVAKAALLPYPVMEKALAGLTLKKGDEGLFLSLVPATVKVKVRHTRLAQRLAMLRVVEALRLHAAEKGEFPARLADVAVPLPADQFSGQAFEYKVEGGKAHLKGAVPVGYEKDPTYNVRYELTLRK
jgi:hypothetical protein